MAYLISETTKEERERIRKEQEADATLQQELQAKLTTKKAELETERQNKEDEYEEGDIADHCLGEVRQHNGDLTAEHCETAGDAHI